MGNLEISLPDSFFEEEVRCGYHVSAKMKKVWAVELDLLNQLLNVCKKHKITIYASGGTMLGAVRHQGFIPWDDDIDMMLPRDQYEILCDVAEFEFQYPYFFQTEYTDPGSLRGHAQLRNSLTTGILHTEMGKYKFNQGIFIDIFPLDNVIDDTVLFFKQKKRALFYKNCAYKISRWSSRYYGSMGVKGKIKKFVYPMSNYIICKLNLEQFMYKKFEKECQRYNSRATERFSTLSFQFSNKQHFKWRSDYEELIELPFEILKIPVGKEFDHGLKARYGAYKTILRDENCHGEVYFNVDKSYLDYL